MTRHVQGAIRSVERTGVRGKIATTQKKPSKKKSSARASDSGHRPISDQDDHYETHDLHDTLDAICALSKANTLLTKSLRRETSPKRC